jgi:uncharacterized membrane protein YkoI
MIKKNALLVASALTAFVLVMIGGVAGRLSASAAASNEEVQTASVSVDPQALAGVLQEREGAYRQLIDQANQILIAEAAATATPAAPTYPVSADTAVAIVLTTVRGAALQSPPELVDYMGAVAYEVSLDRGLVYVDANTGKILANGAIPVVVVKTVESSGSGGGGGGGGHEDDRDEHEDEHEDDHESDD